MTDTRLSFVVFGCITKEKYLQELNSTRRTWAAVARERGHRVYYIFGEQRLSSEQELENRINSAHLETGEEFVYLPGVGDDLASATPKQNLGLAHAFDIESIDTQYFVVCGTDTYIHIPQLVELLATLPATKLYLGGDGHKIDFPDGSSVDFVSGGPPLVFSRDVVETLRPGLPALENKWHNFCNGCRRRNRGFPCLKVCSDVALAYCLKQDFGIHPVSFTDRFKHERPRDYDIDPRTVIAYHHLYDEDFVFLHNLHSNSFTSLPARDPQNLANDEQ